MSRADILTTRAIEILERLVAFDTRNPPRAFGKEGIFAFLAGALGPAFSCTLRDLGDGCLSLLAVRGITRVMSEGGPTLAERLIRDDLALALQLLHKFALPMISCNINETQRWQQISTLRLNRRSLHPPIQPRLAQRKLLKSFSTWI